MEISVKTFFKIFGLLAVAGYCSAVTAQAEQQAAPLPLLGSPSTGAATTQTTVAGTSDGTNSAVTKKPLLLEQSVNKETIQAADSKATVTTGGANKAWAADSPVAVIQNYESEIRKIIHKYDNRKNAAAVAERDKLLGAKVRKFFDFEELARQSMVNHWAKLTNEQRKRFIGTFTRLIERSYLNKTREMIADYAVVYDDQEVTPTNAKVNSTIKKNDLDVKVVYELKRPVGYDPKQKGAAQWVIYNVVFDNLDLLSNYKSQFNRIISQKSFSELLRIMEDRIKNPAETA